MDPQKQKHNNTHDTQALWKVMESFFKQRKQGQLCNETMFN
jgi:hypothetical protein